VVRRGADPKAYEDYVTNRRRDNEFIKLVLGARDQLQVFIRTRDCPTPKSAAQSRSDPAIARRLRENEDAMG